MSIKTFFIDTFTSEAFRGNPTAVCLSESSLTAEKMLSAAAEFGFPVTAFVLNSAESNEYEIRYFTPTTEITACGHATLASARALFLSSAQSEAVFLTVGGQRLKTNSDDFQTTMIYPKNDLQECAVKEEILLSLSLQNYSSAGFCSELETLFIEVENLNALKEIQPDFARLVKSSDEIKEVVVMCGSDNPHYDYFLRSFCPWIGIDEDPVTGSVQTVLADFWGKRLSKNELVAYQMSARDGEIHIKSLGDKVEIGGKSVTILKGDLTI